MASGYSSSFLTPIAIMLAFKSQVALAPFTTFHIGGPAEYFVEVTTVGELVEALDHAKKNNWSTFVLAGGSNLLIHDRGIRGLVIRVANKSFRIEGEKLLADAGVPLLDLVRAASAAGLSGMERLAGIPGSLGGAVRGNAGAFGMEIGTVTRSVKVYDRQQSALRSFSREQCAFHYRSSYFKSHPELVILSVELRLQAGEREELQSINEATMAKREAKHPQSALCAGSFFMNPVVSDTRLHAEFEKDTGMASKDEKLPAGWLIDHVGLRGKQIGGAQISPKHPNYLINTGTATAEEVIMLASVVKQRVRDELGIQLKEEVQLVGF